MLAHDSGAEKQLKEWLHSGLKKHQIAIVTARSAEAGCLHGKSTLAGVALTNDLEEWRTGKAILLSTVGKFKGLEAEPWCDCACRKHGILVKSL